MKVLSVIEPWGSLIKEGVKKIETRSWKTNFRGEIYIHTSIKKVPKKDERIDEVIKLLKDKDFKYGYIIAKCNLVDCVYMDEKFIEEVKKSRNEYICGKYEIGRYGWILEDVEVLYPAIHTKGRLGIWNYND